MTELQTTTQDAIHWLTRRLLNFALVGMFVVSCSEPPSATSDLDPGDAIALCLDKNLSRDLSEYTEITYAFLRGGRARSYIFHVFTGEFYPINRDKPIPVTNMVVAAKMSDGYFQALRENPPKNPDDYKLLRERFGEADDSKMLDITRHGDLTFVNSDLAIVRKTEPSLPRQKYLLHEGKWIYQIISDRSPGLDMRSKVRAVLTDIDRQSNYCEVKLSSSGQSQTII